MVWFHLRPRGGVRANSRAPRGGAINAAIIIQVLIIIAHHTSRGCIIITLRVATQSTRHGSVPPPCRALWIALLSFSFPFHTQSPSSAYVITITGGGWDVHDRSASVQTYGVQSPNRHTNRIVHEDDTYYSPTTSDRHNYTYARGHSHGSGVRAGASTRGDRIRPEGLLQDDAVDLQPTPDATRGGRHLIGRRQHVMQRGE